MSSKNGTADSQKRAGGKRKSRRSARQKREKREIAQSKCADHVF